MYEFEYQVDGDDVTIDLYIEGRWADEIKVDKWELLRRLLYVLGVCIAER